ncbi:Sucrase-isomaltase, intestinal, partial [Calypte anna]
DVQYVDIDYMNRQMDFTLSDKFAGLPALVDDIKKEGMRFVIILDPGISGNESVYASFDRGVQDDVFIKRPNSNEIIYTKVWPFLPNVEINESLPLHTQIKLYGAHTAFPDFLRNSTINWWKREILDYYKILKFDGLWIDMNEPAALVNGALDGCRNDILNSPPYMPALGYRSEGLSFKTPCMEGQQYLSDGTPVRHFDVHSLYGWSQTKPTLDGLQSATKERGFVLTRSTYPSSGRWAGHWLGDNSAAWDQIWKSVIDHKGNKQTKKNPTACNVELFFLSVGLGFGTNQPSLTQVSSFFFFQRQDPVSWNSTFEDISRHVLNIRYKLLPYLYTLMYEAHAHGSTVTRPLLNEFVQERDTWDVYQQFLWGPALLITPVLYKGDVTVRAYIPNTRWYDYHTEQDIGFRGQYRVLDAPLDHINLHIRGGYILPWQTPSTTTFHSRKNPMGLTVALGDNSMAEGKLYWDDGVRIGTY